MRTVAALSLSLLCLAPLTGRADADRQLPVSQHQLIKITDSGPSTRELRMKLSDAILFLVNQTGESLLGIEVNFKDKITHCASSNLTIDSDGTVRSTRPIAPNDFASLCFHDAGTYPFKVKGAKVPVEGVVIVEE